MIRPAPQYRSKPDTPIASKVLSDNCDTWSAMQVYAPRRYVQQSTVEHRVFYGTKSTKEARIHGIGI